LRKHWTWFIRTELVTVPFLLLATGLSMLSTTFYLQNHRVPPVTVKKVGSWEVKGLNPKCTAKWERQTRARVLCTHYSFWWTRMLQKSNTNLLRAAYSSLTHSEALTVAESIISWEKVPPSWWLSKQGHSCTQCYKYWSCTEQCVLVTKWTKWTCTFIQTRWMFMTRLWDVALTIVCVFWLPTIWWPKIGCLWNKKKWNPG
jgi:hypothetical protein